MGREVCRTVVAQPDLELVAAVDTNHVGAPLASLVGPEVGGLQVTDQLGELRTTGTEVAVDFTRIDAARATLAFCADHGIHAVVGTSGFSEEELVELARTFAGTDSSSNCIVAANFAIGAVLMMRFAELAAPFFDGAEIIELHHDGKSDAPSGTALATAARMATARSAAGASQFPPDRTLASVVEGARGASGPAGVRLHSVRLPGLVAHQEVILGAVGQTLSLRHDSTDRASFMDGVVLAVRAVTERPGLTVGLQAVLGL
jgi:4-hydroxy-tetrahydrodipicolinate reductase